jgi:hypothetical protein
MTCSIVLPMDLEGSVLNAILGYEFKSRTYTQIAITQMLWESLEETPYDFDHSTICRNPVDIAIGSIDTFEYLSKVNQVPCLAIVCDEQTYTANESNDAICYLMNQSYGEKFSHVELLERGWTFHGYDVVDPDGMFSVFDMRIDLTRGFELTLDGLFASVESARIVAVQTGVEIPSHSPLYAMPVYVYWPYDRHMLNYLSK